MAVNQDAPVKRILDPGILVAIVMATVVSWAFFVQPGLPTDTDAEIHIFRAEQVKGAITTGTLYPRWAPDMYYGNGYPIFNYYAPLAYHAAAYYSILTGLDVVAGTKFVLVLAAYMGICGMYLFVRDRWSAEAALVAAAAWGFSPYIMFLEPHARGEVAETLALGISPMVFWAFSRLCIGGGRRYVPVAALSLGALIMSHPLAALAVYALLVGYLLYQLLIAPNVEHGLVMPPTSKVLPLVIAALALGLGVAAVYWIPAGLEQDAVRLDFYGKGHYDFRQHFIPASELVAGPVWIDLGAVFPEFAFSLGTAQSILGMLGAMTLLHSGIRKYGAVYLSLATLFSVYLMTDASLGMWEVIPPMRFFQFPMRFLGPAALTLAPLAGMAVAWGATIGRARWLPGALAGGMMVCLYGASMPLTYPSSWDEFGEVSVQRLVEEELNGKWLGTTCCHDFVPIDVKEIPPPEDRITQQYDAGLVEIERFDRESLPDGVTIESVDSGTEHDRMVVDAAEPFRLQLHRYYYIGWKAFIDDVETPLYASEPFGKMELDIPQGVHEVTVSMEATGPRRIGGAITIAASALILAITVLGRGKATTRVMGTNALSATGLVFGIVGLVGIISLKVAADNAGWFRHESAGREVAVSENPYYAIIEDEIELLAFDLYDSTVLRGDVLPVTLYWKATMTPSRNYQVYVHLRSRTGELWGQSDRLNPGGLPTTRWPSDKYIQDRHELVVDPETPAGVYELYVGLWVEGSEERYIAYDEHGLMLGDSVPLRVDVNVAQLK